MKTDDLLYNTIKDKLAFEPDVDPDKIAIAVHDGIVTLGGVVHRYSEKLSTESAIKTIRGVRGIANEIKVEALPIYQRDDIDIAKTAVQALVWSMNVPSEQIKVVVEEGWLRLTGEVNWQYQRQAAESAIRNIYGLKGVLNQIIIKPSIAPSDVKNKIIKEFERNAAIDAQNVEVEVMDSRIILKGKVRNWFELQEAVNAAWALPGISMVENHLTIKP